MQPSDTSPVLPTPPGVQYLPGEDVLLLAVGMPTMPAAQRRAAVAFAVEDRIAASLDDVHVILGPAMADGATWLVAVIARDVLARVTADRKARLLPDVLALPVPDAGEWAVWTDGARAIVRTPDGAGFACPLGHLPTYHLAAMRPRIALFGGTLGAAFADQHPAPWPSAQDTTLARFDLNTARVAARGLALPKTWARLAAILVFAALGHIGLLVADTWALGQIKAELDTNLRDTLNAMGYPAGDDAQRDAAQILGRANGTAGPRLIPMMARTFAALAPQTGRVTLSDLRYGADQNSLTITLQAPDIATLQSVEGAVSGAGFRVTAGAATTANGLAEQQLILQGGDA